MSTVIFISQTKPDKKLIQEFVYKYMPSAQMKEQILKELEEHTKAPLDNYIVEVDVRIRLKEYDTKNTRV